MRAALLIGGLAFSSLAAAIEWGFDDITAPLTLRPEAPMQLRSEACGWCHAEQYADWQSSRHRQSWTNDIFQAGYIVEPQDFCVYCHAPLAEQTAEVLNNRAWYRAQHPRSTVDPLPLRAPEPYAAEGVNCVTCHWRQGQLYGPTGPEGAAHPVDRAEDMQAADFCAGCHEFPMAQGRGGQIHFTDEPMQKTYQEWRAWGGAQTCQSCHMPEGRHTFRGAHDLSLLRASIDVTATRADPQTVHFCVESVGVGHHVPTGDLFRHLTLEVDDGAGFQTVADIGRTFHLIADPQTGEISKHQKSDTALRPGVPQTFVVTARPGARWRLRYHYGSPKDEQLGLVPLEAMIVEIAAGRL